MRGQAGEASGLLDYGPVVSRVHGEMRRACESIESSEAFCATCAVKKKGVNAREGYEYA